MGAIVMPRSLSQFVGRWIAELRWDDAPEAVRKACLEGVFQSVAGGVAGFAMPETRIALEMARREGEKGPSTIFGDGLKVPTATAIFVNAAMFCSLEQQEMHVASGSHPYQVIVPATLVLAERMGSNGQDFLTAVLAGTEAMLALAIVGLEVAPEWGMETSQAGAVYGAIGAAASTAKLMKLDVESTTWALSHAANLAAGLAECLWAGTTEYHWALANASRVGYLAAQLASLRAEAAPTTFEGRAGFYHRFSELSEKELGGVDLAGRVSLRLGHVWETPEHIYKRYPVHFNNLAFVDAAKTLRERHRIVPGQITAIRITINRWCELCNGANLGPYHGREATRGATAFGVATMLARGRYSLDDAYDHDAADINALIRKTTIGTFPDPARSRDWRSLRLEVDAGATHVYDGAVEGVPDYRLPMAELRVIADDALSRVLGKSQTRDVLDALEALESCSNIREVIARLVPLKARI
jgi:2-methylcitrate dehydratase PrpD